MKPLLLALIVLSILSFFPFQTALAHTVSISSAKVVTLYETIFGGDVQSVVRQLADTGTQVVFRGYWGSDDALGRVPIDEFRKLNLRLTEIKQQLPEINIMGGLTGTSFYEDGWWPNGTSIGKDSVQQMSLVLPNGVTPRFYGNPVLDIRKPLGREFLLAWAYGQLDAGVDSIFFDYIDYASHVAVDVPESSFIAAWQMIASSVKEYATTKLARQVTVTIGEGVLWPDQDFLTKSVKLETIEKQEITDDWSRYKAQIQSVYGKIPPVMIFVDWGGARTPMETFVKLPTQEQISMLRLLSASCVEEGFLFVYPLHKEHLYDAVSQGTYDAIRELTNKVTGVQSSTTAPLTTVVSTLSHTTETTTVPSPSTPPTIAMDTVRLRESESTLLEGFLPIVIMVVVIAGILAAAITLRKKKQSPS
jgi:dihydroxyacetone kinase DhaKLM complex PTS-EIIA-like component DhaM